VGRGAVVRNSILWDKVVVEEGAVVDGVICDKRCVIGKGACVGGGDGEAPPNEAFPGSLRNGVSVLGMDVHVPAGGVIGKNCVVYPKVSSDFLSDPIRAGATVRGASR